MTMIEPNIAHHFLPDIRLALFAATLILSVLGSIVFGLATPTEAAAVGAFYGQHFAHLQDVLEMAEDVAQGQPPIRGDRLFHLRIAEAAEQVNVGGRTLPFVVVACQRHAGVRRCNNLHLREEVLILSHQFLLA